MWKKLRRVATYFIIILILLINIVGLVKYMKLKNESKKYNNQNISINIDYSVDLVGLMDSYGVPYNKNVTKSFMNILEDSLNESNKLNSSLDLFNLYANKTWQLDGVFDNGVTIGEFNDIKNFSLDFTRHKYPEMIKTGINYEVDSDLENVAIYDYVADLENPVIVYSCTANDLFYYFGASPETLNAEKVYDIWQNLDSEAKALGGHVSGNIDTILNCNSNSRVIVMGLYLPSDNYFLHLAGNGVIDEFNKEIKSACDEYDNVYYLDVTCLAFNVLEGDFHPDQNGQHIMAAKISEVLNSKCKKKLNKNRLNEKSFTYTDNSDEKLDVDLIVKTINDSDLPIDDYVEYAVAFEWALYECEIQNIDFQEIQKKYFEIVNCYDETEKEKIEKALNVEIAEKKMLYGIDETVNAMNSEGIQNDKLSLLSYY